MTVPDESRLPPAPAPLAPVAAAESAPARFRSEDLLQGRREILIVHSQEVYRLRLTRNGKLILTK